MAENNTESPLTGQDAEQPGDETVSGNVNKSSYASSVAFEEMLQCLRELRDRYEIPDKFFVMMRRAQNQRDMTVKQVTRGLAEIERLSKKMEVMVQEEMERRQDFHETLQAWVDTVDKPQQQQQQSEKCQES